jgi:hypothetical protein
MRIHDRFSRREILTNKEAEFFDSAPCWCELSPMPVLPSDATAKTPPKRLWAT